MKRSTKIFIIILVIFLVLCHIDFRPWFYEQQKKYLNQVDETRKDYNIGSCYNMQDDFCYYIIFIDDNESNWTENDKAEFVEKKFLPSINYLSKQSSTYNVVLKQDYRTCEKNANYDGVIEVETVQNEVQYDIFTQAAASLGYKSAKEMNDSLKKELNVKQVAYLFTVNKEGRSYKLSHSQTAIERKYEFCVLFSQSIGYTEETCYSTIAHEILHLFGAEDYYDPYGDYPEREKLAKKLYPNDIMFGTVADVNTVSVGSYTAYSVGWIDELPKECDTDNWWK